MNPENLLQFIQNLFSGGKQQSPEESKQDLTAWGASKEEFGKEYLSRIDKHFGTGVGLEEIDWNRFNEANKLLFNVYKQPVTLEDGSQGWGMPEYVPWRREGGGYKGRHLDARIKGESQTFAQRHSVTERARPADVIDFIERTEKEGRALFGHKDIPFPQLANIIKNPNISTSKLYPIFEEYSKVLGVEDAPSYTVPQELLSEWGEQNIGAVQEFFKQMYPEGDFTSAQDVLGRIKLGDKPGGVTLNIGDVTGTKYRGKGGWYDQPSFMREPLYGGTSGKPSGGYIGPVGRRPIESSFEEKSEYRPHMIPTSAAEIHIGSMFPKYALGRTKSPGFHEYLMKNAPGRMGKTLIHEFGHSSPQFTQRIREQEYEGTEHQPYFTEMVDAAIAGNRIPGFRPGASQATTDILNAYLQSPQYQKQTEHPYHQLIDFLKSSGIDYFPLRQ